MSRQNKGEFMEPTRPLTTDSESYRRQGPTAVKYQIPLQIKESALAKSLRTLSYASIAFTVLTLVPAMAHLFEMPAKMRMSAADYLAVQQLYQGWAVLGVFTVLAIVCVATWTYYSRRLTNKETFNWVSSALVCLVASQIVYWSFTFPAIRATENWTTLPDNWMKLRNYWEYSHAANAGFLALATVCLLTAALIVPKRALKTL
jgi:hypothetical protein